MTPHGKCVKCSREATHAVRHKKTLTVISRLCTAHLGFAPKKSITEKLEPLPVEPEATE